MRHHVYPSWSIQLPEDWETEAQEECLACYQPAGVGVLQLSSVIKQAGDVSAADLAANAERNGEQVKPESRYGDFLGWESSTAEEGSYWRKWHLRAGKTLLFVTYNCALEDRAAEDRVIEAAMDSLRRESAV